VSLQDSSEAAGHTIGVGLGHGLANALPQTFHPHLHLALPVAIHARSLTSLQQGLFGTGGHLIRHPRYFTLQLAEGQLTQR
jgi:hypothetical protein